MINHIDGKLVDKTPTHVVIDCNGVGYSINISLQTFSKINDERCKLFTHLSVKEDSHTLYGFITENERKLFRHLISVSGVGPSTAQVILSTYKSDEIINYISASDVAAIKNVKGIGLKTAQRIIIDLKDKVTKSAISDEISLDLNNTIQNEALSALVALGFSKKIAQQKIDKALTNKQSNFDVETLIRESLSQM
ncbi:Holliday junction branch migration protein RuvA [Bacteroidota bacterium]|nr:Holliday junction branch migration protein RuvA [Bacteroidota bacterium]MDC3115192.1 Holliday junction branch migration protein RuvA [Bacteroidota bacterium]MDC3230199.1 Holliday junction branch migration protein RuvA [Bacteroidota bacterium]